MFLNNGHLCRNAIQCSDHSEVHHLKHNARNQGCLFFYYTPQMLGNNFSTLGKNSKFLGKKERKEKSKEIIMKKNEKKKQ